MTLLRRRLDRGGEGACVRRYRPAGGGNRNGCADRAVALPQIFRGASKVGGDEGKAATQQGELMYVERRQTV